MWRGEDKNGNKIRLKLIDAAVEMGLFCTPNMKVKNIVEKFTKNMERKINCNAQFLPATTPFDRNNRAAFPELFYTEHAQPTRNNRIIRLSFIDVMSDFMGETCNRNLSNIQTIDAQTTYFKNMMKHFYTISTTETH